MQGYGSKEMASSFRTVRANTIKIAEEIPEDKYGFRPAEGTRTVAETLAHLAVAPEWSEALHTQRITNPTFEMFLEMMGKAQKAMEALKTKTEILDALRKNGEKFAAFLDSFPEAALEERVHFPAGSQPPERSRFEMLLATKEHEMHHRGQLMLIERMLGIVPHLTREMQARMAQMQPQTQASKA
jgi:uncharacterized damage-inducible protein DinB